MGHMCVLFYLLNGVNFLVKSSSNRVFLGENSHYSNEIY